MLKYFILYISIILFSQLLIAQDYDIHKIRQTYEKSGMDEDENLKLLELSKHCQTPIITGYYASALTIQAKFVFNPFSKLEHFNKGTKLLDKTIAENPDNIELRFMRFCIQTRAPKFLGYDNMLEIDIKLIVEKFLTIDPDVMQSVANYMLQDENCSDADKTKIKEHLAK